MQIKPIQIIPGRKSRVNPGSSLPIDLDPVQRDLVLDPIITVEDPILGQAGSQEFATQSTESVLAETDPVPQTPAIISVKEQIVKFMPDGTAKIDLVLEVQDIQGAVEYDIRVAKNAGTL